MPLRRRIRDVRCRASASRCGLSMSCVGCRRQEDSMNQRELHKRVVVAAVFVLAAASCGGTQKTVQPGTTETTAAPAPPPAAAAPGAPPAPTAAATKEQLPAGTPLTVRIIDPLSSESVSQGTKF